MGGSGGTGRNLKYHRAMPAAANRSSNIQSQFRLDCFHHASLVAGLASLLAMTFGVAWMFVIIPVPITDTVCRPCSNWVMKPS